MDIVHSLEPDILKIDFLYVAGLLCNRNPIENASDATLRLGKVINFKQIGQLTKTKNSRIWGKTEHSK